MDNKGKLFLLQGHVRETFSRRLQLRNKHIIFIIILIM